MRYEKPFVIQSPTQGVFMGWERVKPRFSIKAKLSEGQRFTTYEEASTELRRLFQTSRGKRAYITKLGQHHSGPFQPSKGTWT